MAPLLPVRLVFFEQAIACDSCAPTRRVLDDIAGSHPHVSVEAFNLALDGEQARQYGVDRVPAVVISAPGRDRIRFYGAPLGNELPAFVAAIRMTASGESGLSERHRAQVRQLTAHVAIHVFFTPSCVYCPQMIELACQLAVESPFISAIAVDATEYPDLVRTYNVNGVPKTVIDGRLEIMGAVPADELVRQLAELGERASP